MVPIPTLVPLSNMRESLKPVALVNLGTKLVVPDPVNPPVEGTTLHPVFTDASAAAAAVAITSSPIFKAYCDALSQ